MGFYKIILFVVINIVLELCKNYVRDKKQMSFKLDISPICVGQRDAPFMRCIRAL